MTTTRRRRVDLSFGPGHGPVSGVLNAAGAICALTMWLYDGHLSWAFGLAAGVLMATAAVVVAAAYEQPERVLWFRTACWTLAGMWSGWVLCGFHGIRLWPSHIWILTALASPASPWAWRPIAGLAIGAAVLGYIGWLMQRAEDRAEKAAADGATQPLNVVYPRGDDIRAIRDRWEPFILRITKVPVRILAVEKWQPFYGFTLDCQLPADGTQVEDLKRYEGALATAAPEFDGGLPDGCGVEIQSKAALGRQNFDIRVTTVNALGQDVPYPDDLSPDTIVNPLPIGVLTDRTVREIPMRFESVTLVGNTDSGKSNQLNVLITALARCTDVLLVGIDTSGNGRVFRPWIRAYHEGRAARPVFAQVAPNDHRARLLCASLIDIVDGRTADYAELMHRNGWDKIEPSPALPQIVLVIDEFGKLPNDVQDMVKTLTDTGRGAAVRVISCALEATGAYIPRPIVTQSRVRVAMRVVDEAQLAFLFDATWKRCRVDPASMPWRGSGLVAVGPETPTGFKGYRIDPARVDQISLACAGYRPTLDEASLRRGDTVTVKVMTDTGRVERTFDGVWSNAEADTYPLIFSTAGAATTTTSEVGIVGSAEDNLRTAMGNIGGALGGLQDAMGALEDAAAGAGGEPRNVEPPDDRDDDDGDDDDPPAPTPAQLQAWYDGPTTAEPGARHPSSLPTVQRRTLQIVAEHADRGGVGPSAVHRILAAAGYPTNLTTVQLMLKDMTARGILAQPAGDRTPYLPGPSFPDRP